MTKQSSDLYARRTHTHTHSVDVCKQMPQFIQKASLNLSLLPLPPPSSTTVSAESALFVSANDDSHVQVLANSNWYCTEINTLYSFFGLAWPETYTSANTFTFTFHATHFAGWPVRDRVLSVRAMEKNVD